MVDQTYTEKEIEKMKEKGLYYPGGSFQSEQKIKRRMALEGKLPVLETPLPGKKGFDYWSQRFRTRQKQYQETAHIIEKQHVEISFSGDTVLNFIGDPHVGSPNVDYKRLEQEVATIINTPNSFVILVGDLVDGFFFNPAQMEDMESVPEQWAYINALMQHLAENGKLLIGFGGDHDGWPKKMGIDPYYKFAEELRAYYMQGVGHLTAKVDDQEYKLTGAHRLPGHSIRDNTWAPKRASAEIQGADVYYSCHTHQKGHSYQAIKEFGGTARKVHFISLGPYKSTDEYSRKRGWSQQSSEEMYGSAVKLFADKRGIEYYDSILEANKV